MKSLKQLKKIIYDNDIQQSQIALVLGLSAPGISKMLSLNNDHKSSSLIKIESAINIIIANRSAKDRGVIVLDAVEFKNTLFNSIIPELEIRMDQGAYVGDIADLSETLVEIIIEKVTTNDVTGGEGDHENSI